MPILAECNICGRPKLKAPSQLKKHNFCSRECRLIWFAALNKERRNKITRFCERCGRLFETYPCWIKRNEGRFCSRTCQSKAHSQFMVEMWANPDIRAVRAPMAIRNLNLRPNFIELRLLRLLMDIDQRWEYVGDGSVIIGGLNPDYILGYGIVELFGEYWHTQNEIPRRAAIFHRQGYNTLVIWEHELKDEQAVVTKVKQFMVATCKGGTSNHAK